MTKFTKEEISLCKQVAEKHRRLIKYGDWMILEDDPNEFPALHFGQAFPLKTKLLPLWTIPDCLEFFEKRKFQLSLNHFRTQGYCLQLWRGKETQSFYSDYTEERKPVNKTPLESLLKAVLAVLEEE